VLPTEEDAFTTEKKEEILKLWEQASPLSKQAMFVLIRSMFLPRLNYYARALDCKM